MFAQRAFWIGLLLVAAAAWPVHAFAAQLTLTWTDASDNEVGFKIERRPGLTETYAEISRPGADTTAYVDSNLPAGATYCYRVRAFNSAGDSDYSNEACATTPADFALTLIRSGTGSGSVSSAPSGISCGTDCAEAYPSGTTIVLVATAEAGSTFAGWSGACSGKRTCTITLAGDAQVWGSFRRQRNARK